jgi:SsrA-binding protein
MCAQSKTGGRYTEIRNPKALRDYFVHGKFEAGISLLGTEVKSIRAGKAQLADAFGRIEKGEAWLYNAYIEEYFFGNSNNHDPRRPRKLLLNRSELRKIAQAMDTGGNAFIALRLYFKEALVKVEMALCTGKQLFDKRADLKKKEQVREMNQGLKFRR